LKRAHQILTKRGFLILADPSNDLGDGKTWVLECERTDKLPKDADLADLARQCLQSNGMGIDGVFPKGRILYVTLSPPAQRTTQASPESDRQRLRFERLRETYGVNLSQLPQEGEQRGQRDREARAKLVDLGKNGLAASHTHVPKIRSALKNAVLACPGLASGASAKEILEWLQRNNPRAIPPSWNKDDTLPGKYFSKVRKLM
jgi:hypothetical protein